MDLSEYEQLRAIIKGRLTRAELDAVRRIIRPGLEQLQIGVAAVSGKELHNQQLRLTYRGEQYAVPVDVFTKKQLFQIADRIVMAHERAHKTPP